MGKPKYMFEAEVRNDPSGWLIAKSLGRSGKGKYWNLRRILAVFLDVPVEARRMLHGRRVRITISAVECLLLLLLPSGVLCEEEAPQTYTLTVEARLPTGALAYSVRFEISDLQGVKVAETLAAGGRAVFLLPRGSYLVRASTDYWHEEKTVALDGDRTLVFTVGVKVGIPVDMTIQTPGGFRITFEPTKNVLADVKSGKGGRFTLTVKDFAVVFESNQTDVYYVNITVRYERLVEQTLWIESFSTETGASMRTAIPVAASLLVLTGEVRGFTAPHFPTPEEIARAQLRYLEQVRGDLEKRIRDLSETVSSLEDTLESQGERIQRLTTMFSELNTRVSGVAVQTQKDASTLRETVEVFTSNAWGAIAVLAAVSCGTLFAVLLKGRGEEEAVHLVQPAKRRGGGER